MEIIISVSYTTKELDTTTEDSTSQDVERNNTDEVGINPTKANAAYKGSLGETGDLKGNPEAYTVPQGAQNRKYQDPNGKDQDGRRNYNECHSYDC